MRILLITMLTLMLAGTAWAADKAKGDDVLKTDMDKLSYSLGVDIAGQLKKQKDMDLDPELLAKGLVEHFQDKDLLISPEEATQIIQLWQRAQQQKQAERMKQEAKENLEKADAFLSANKKKDGVEATESGLQYKVLTKGDGPMPEVTDRVSVHYRGTLMDGTEFDSSYKRGQPATFPLKGVIPGWTEALQLMPVGSKYELYIPPNLAYGERPGSPTIPPNALLIFEVELLEIAK